MIRMNVAYIRIYTISMLLIILVGLNIYCSVHISLIWGYKVFIQLFIKANIKFILIL